MLFGIIRSTLIGYYAELETKWTSVSDRDDLRTMKIAMSLTSSSRQALGSSVIMEYLDEMLGV